MIFQFIYSYSILLPVSPQTTGAFLFLSIVYWPMLPGKPERPCLLITLKQITQGPGAVVKAVCLESLRSRVRTPVWHSSFKEAKCFFSAHSGKFNIVGSLRDREVAGSASDCQGSNFEFCSCVWGQCHLIHLRILERFSWPSLAYLCTKVA